MIAEVYAPSKQLPHWFDIEGRGDLNEILTLTIAAVAAAVALVTLLKRLIEYQQQGRQKRAEQFFQLRRRMKDNPKFQRLRELIERQTASSEEFAKVPFEAKRDVGLKRSPWSTPV